MGLFQESPIDGIPRTSTAVSRPLASENQVTDISVVIVGWNAKHYLGLCLESLAEALARRSMNPRG
jgi:hypothetical protein